MLGAQALEPAISRVSRSCPTRHRRAPLPQETGIKLRYNNRGSTFRVSTPAEIFGEEGVLRILDKEALKLDLTQSVRRVSLEKFNGAIHQP